MYAVYRDQQENIDFIPDVLANISELPERLRTIRSLLQIISDRFHCSFILFNQKGELISEGQWPWSAGWNYNELVQYFLDFPEKAMSMSHTKMHIDKKDVFVTYSIVTPEHKTQLHLFVIDEQKSITHEQTSQAAELIALFMSISNFSLEETSPEMIIRSIIKNEQMQIRELSAKHSIDTTRIQRMWILSGSDGLGAYKQKRLLKQDVTKIRKFFRNRDRWALVDLYQNAIVVLFRVAAFSEFDERIEAEISFHGGQARNAIPASAEAKITLCPQHLPQAFRLLEKLSLECKAGFGEIEQSMAFRWALDSEDISAVVPTPETDALLRLLLTLPDGVHSVSPYVPGLTESSQNLGLLAVSEGEMRLAAMSRSCAAYRAKELLAIDRAIAAAFGFTFEQGEHSPAWAVNPKSRLTPLTCQVYKELTGQDMVVEPIHGALECGAFSEKNPRLDMIAIGPSLFDVHTPKERCDLHSVQVTNDLVIGILERLCE